MFTFSGGIRKCTLCEVRVESMDEAEKHYKLNHEQEVPVGFWRKTSGKPVKCPECNDVFRYLRFHIKYKMPKVTIFGPKHLTEKFQQPSILVHIWNFNC